MVKVATDGLTLGVSAGLPATQTQLGYEALTFTTQEACSIVDAGKLGDAWTEITDNTLCVTGSGKNKGKREFGDLEMVLKYERAAAVAAILQTAFDNQADVVSLKITLSNGDVRYLTAQVAVLDENYGSSGSEVEQPVTFWPQVVPVRVDGA